MTENNKGKNKRKGDEKQAKTPKKQWNEPVENKVPLPKYTNYHSLAAQVDHIYVVTNKNFYRQPDAMKGDRSRRDCKRNGLPI